MKLLIIAKDLLSDEKLEVYEFGENCDLVLHIYKDEDYNPDKDRDYCNIVTISTARDGKFVDDTDDVYVSDGSLDRELKRINEYRDLPQNNMRKKRCRDCVSFISYY